MPSDFSAHIRKYEHNKMFVSRGIADRNTFTDWEVTAQFYAAVHLIEAVIHNALNCECIDHDARGEILRNNPEIFSPKVRTCYKNLKTAANTARYSPEIKVSANAALKAQADIEDIEHELSQRVRRSAPT